MVFVGVFLFIVGVCIGSFLNVLIDRLPQERSIGGRSYCEHCRHKLLWYDLVPLISFLLLKGKCRYCKYKIPSVIPVIEVITGVLFISSWFFVQSPSLFSKILYLGLISCVIVIFFADVKYQIIPDSIQVAFFVFICAIFLMQGFPIQFFINQFLAGIMVMSPILLIFLITKANGMGFGDVKLAFNIGFFLGIVAGLMALYVAFVVGAIFGIFLMIMKKKKLKSTIAFGPFLIIGIVVMFFWQNNILEIMGKLYGMK